MHKIKTRKSSRHILYLGDFLDEQIVRERGLSSVNPAGSNRMARIAKSMKAVKENCLIVSPAIAMRIKQPSHVLQPGKCRRHQGIPVYYAPAFCMPYIGHFVSIITLFFSFIMLAKKRNIEQVIIYNFNPIIFFALFAFACFSRIEVIHEIEDISIPKFDDWREKSETSAIQQNILYFFMKCTMSLSRKFIVPTKKFLIFIPSDRKTITVTGCIEEVSAKPLEATSAFNPDEYRILLAGKISFENGIGQFVSALLSIERDIQNNLLKKRITVDICGGGKELAWLDSQLSNFNNLQVVRHGFIPRLQYEKILRRSDICLALQDPSGRHGNFKTPSKVYEFLGWGKMVIATKVGDLSELPNEVIMLCDPFCGDELARLIKNIANGTVDVNEYKEHARRYAFDNFRFQAVGARIQSFLNS